jgi:Arc/MetJ family transcription regulator
VYGEGVELRPREYRDQILRSSLEIDDRLMSEALRLTGARSKREVVELRLQQLVRLARQAKIRSLRGKVQWQGDLEAMRKEPVHYDSDRKAFERPSSTRSKRGNPA